MTRSFTSAIIGAAVAVQCLGEVPEPPNEPVEPPAVAFARAKPKIIEEATAPEVLMACRSMLPVRPVALNGSIILRNRRGIVQSEHDYRLVMRRRPDVSRRDERDGERNDLKARGEAPDDTPRQGRLRGCGSCRLAA